MENKTLQGRNPEFSVITEEAEQPTWNYELCEESGCLSEMTETFAFSLWECFASMSSFKEILKKELSGYGYSGHAV